MSLPSPYSTLQKHVDELQWVLRDHACPPATWSQVVHENWSAIAALYAKHLGYPGEPRPGTWLAVVDDSDCTVRLGGPGALWRLEGQSASPGCWNLEGVASPYSKRVFRPATQQEIIKHLAEKGSR